MSTLQPMEPPARGPAPRRNSEPAFIELPLDRRRFLVLVGGTAAYLALRPHMAWARKLAEGVPHLQPWALPDEPPGSAIELSRALIGAAVLAPSKWNSQPWRFEAEGSSIRLVADTQRSLPFTDPDQHEMMISLGAALENMLIAARAYGLRPSVTYFPHQGVDHVVAEMTWSGGDIRRDRPLFAMIPERRTNRREFDGRAIFMQNRAKLTAQVPEDFRLHWIDDHDAIEDLARLSREAVHDRVLDPRAEAEQFAWMRSGDEARKRGDGVTLDALEIGGPAKWLAGRYFNPNSWFLRFGAQHLGKQTQSAIRSAGALALLTAMRAGPPQWLAGGQAYERFALKATQLGIAHQPVNAPITMEKYRPEVLKRFDAAGEEPLMFVRLGHAQQPPASVRRSVALVSSFRSS